MHTDWPWSHIPQDLQENPPILARLLLLIPILKSRRKTRTVFAKELKAVKHDPETAMSIFYLSYSRLAVE